MMLDQHFETVYYALRRLGVPEADLEDCTQEVFVVAAGKLHAILSGRERAFLLGTAVNVASHARRRVRRLREVSEEEGAGTHDAWIDPGMRPDEVVEMRRRRALFDEVIAKMPEDLRTVFVMFEIEELTTIEIGSVLDLPMGTVASRLRRARDEFTRVASRIVARARGGRHG
ncbi:RNA polymerase sigma factor [Polyangium aurulentum]|uniref:RNA polymerase sigma factor n=1 Tax=Polyangium aurulentum TaxID=2567896 RepID=UPI00146B04C5|nr:sigma-70 family RNA polymerase sigma factor [Polyangium aurulentum]UQA57048.1 sigma-70 family RNA polymerase sigma factor [Polyangium aurulentum]